ncbi:unnamed protein product, partial [Ectocarpus sp. 13 AM-2016]
PVKEDTVDVVEDIVPPAGVEAVVPSPTVSDETKDAHILAKRDTAGVVDDSADPADAEGADSPEPSPVVPDEKQDPADAGTVVPQAV